MKKRNTLLALITGVALISCNQESTTTGVATNNAMPKLRTTTTASNQTITEQQAKACLEKILPLSKFNELYPTDYNVNAIDSPATLRKVANSYYSYANLESAFVDLYAMKGYTPLFCSGNKLNDSRELAAILANMSQETNGWSPPQFTENGLLSSAGKMGIPYGLVMITEGSCKDNPATCSQYGTNHGYCDSTDTAANLAASCGTNGKGFCELMYKYCSSLSSQDKTMYYYGRGAKQLTYAYNYAFYGSKIYPENELELALNPDKVNTNGTLGWETGLAYWSIPFAEGLGTFKPSMHDGMFTSTNVQMTGKESSIAEFNRQIGFGKTINLINGGVECGKAHPRIRVESLSRINYYLEFLLRLYPEQIKSVEVTHANNNIDVYSHDDLIYNLTHSEDKKFMRNNKLENVNYTKAYPSYVRAEGTAWANNNAYFYNTFVLDQNYYFAPKNSMTNLSSIKIIYNEDIGNGASSERLDCANVPNYEGN